MPQSAESYTHTHTHTQIVLLCLCSLINFGAFAQNNDNLLYQNANTGSMSARVEELIAEKQAKMEKLKKCKGTTKNLKIAGISTLGITAVGVGANIAEAVILKDEQGKLKAEKANLKTAQDKNEKLKKAAAEAKAAQENKEEDKQAEETVKDPTNCKEYVAVVWDAVKDGKDCPNTPNYNICDNDELIKKINTIKELENWSPEAEQACNDAVKKREAEKKNGTAGQEIDKAFADKCKEVSDDDPTINGTGKDQENSCTVIVSDETKDTDLETEAKKYAEQMKDVGCEKTNIAQHSKTGETNTNKAYYFVTCKTGEKYNRLYINFTNVTCSNNAQEYKNGECQAKQVEQPEPTELKTEEKAETTETKPEEASQAENNSKEKYYIAHELDGSCYKWDFVAVHGASEDALCTGMQKGTWKVVIDGKTYNGLAGCNNAVGSYIGGTKVTSRSIRAKNCWCKRSGATGYGVWNDDAFTGDDCAGLCAERCAKNVLDDPDFRGAVFGK